MVEGKWRKKVVARLNKIAEVIRAHKRIHIHELCFEVGISPSLMYQYKTLLLKRFEDIGFEDGEFYVKSEGEKETS